MDDYLGTQDIETEEEPWSATYEELEEAGISPFWRKRGARLNIDDLEPPRSAPTGDYTTEFTGTIIGDPISISKLKSAYGVGNPASLDSFRGAGPGTPTARPVKMSSFRGLSNKVVINGTLYIDRWDDLNIQFPDQANGLYENPQYSWNNNDNRYIGQDAPYNSNYRGILANQWLMVSWCDNDSSNIESIKSLSIKTRGRHQRDPGTNELTKLDVYMVGKNDAGGFGDISSNFGTTSDYITSSHPIERIASIKSFNQFTGFTGYSFVTGRSNEEKEANLRNFIANGFFLRFQAQRTSPHDPRPLQTEITVEDLVINTQ